MPRFDPKLPASWIAGQTPAKRSKPPGPRVVIPGLDPGIDSRHCGAVPHWVYILANSKRGTLYVGVTGDLVRRVLQHRRGETRGFTTRYAISRYERYEDSLVTQLEDQADRTRQSRLARSLS